MLWVCIHLPGFALEVFHPPVDTPAIVEITHRQRRLVAHANPAAVALGVQTGMNTASARGLCDALRVFMRDPALEQQTLQRLALTAYQFTPYVGVHGRDQLWLEIDSCLRLFGGCQPLLEPLGKALDGEGLPWCMACFPTARGASLLARDRGRVGEAVIFSHDDLLACQLKHTELPDKQIHQMLGTGFASIGDLLRQPDAAIARRFGQATLLYLRQLQGLHPDLRPHFQPPEQFESTLELGHETAQSTALLFPLKRLLLALEHHLQARQQRATEITLTLHGREQRRESLVLTPAHGAWRHALLLDLFRLRLETYTPAHPITALTLAAPRVDALQAGIRDLFAAPGADGLDADTLIDRLRARLGDHRIEGLQTRADHRPEYAWHASAGTPHATPPITTGPRPMWLIEPPRRLLLRHGQPFDDTPLQLLQGPERIDSGWWDDQRICRDYYIAARPEGSLCWIYCTLTQPPEWFLHGLFT